YRTHNRNLRPKTPPHLHPSALRHLRRHHNRVRSPGHHTARTLTTFFSSSCLTSCLRLIVLLFSRSCISFTHPPSYTLSRSVTRPTTTAASPDSARTPPRPSPGKQPPNASARNSSPSIPSTTSPHAPSNGSAIRAASLIPSSSVAAAITTRKSPGTTPSP